MEDLNKIIEEIKSKISKIETYKKKKISIVGNISSDSKLILKNQIKEILQYEFDTQNEQITEIRINMNENIEIINSNIYIFGRYTKESRNMSQTPMIKNKRRIYEKSVSDFSEKYKEFYGADEVIFSSSGREDVDVCVKKRPFILEIKNPKKNLEKIVKFEINVKIDDLMMVKKSVKKIVTCGEKSFKIYEALIFTKSCEKVENQKIFLKQKTPIRVLHRRSNLWRNKSVELQFLESIETEKGWFYKIKVKADGGTYIKEFVNGDFNRTIPSLSSLFESYCDLLELDVVEIDFQQIPDSQIIIKQDTQ